MQTYLSTAFSPRTDAELDFLKGIDQKTGFSLFWIDIVRPLLCHIQARHLMEIGAHRGDHTRLLARYCEACEGTLTVIEPAVLPSLQKIADQSKRVRVFSSTSRDSLTLLDSCIDAVLLEGDLNYHTVYGDLADIEQMAKRQKMPFPLVFLRATGWPYARRDMYYDPTNLPTTGILSYRRDGMSPWSSGLETDMINYPYFNAQQEGGPRNGVLTAAEDFVKESDLPLNIFSLPSNNGLSIIYLKDSQIEEFIKTNFLPPHLLTCFLETVELARLNEIIRGLKCQQARSHILRRFMNKLERVLHRHNQL